MKQCKTLLNLSLNAEIGHSKILCHLQYATAFPWYYGPFLGVIYPLCTYVPCANPPSRTIKDQSTNH